MLFRGNGDNEQFSGYHRLGTRSLRGYGGQLMLAGDFIDDDSYTI